MINKLEVCLRILTSDSPRDLEDARSAQCASDCCDSDAVIASLVADIKAEIAKAVQATRDAFATRNRKIILDAVEKLLSPPADDAIWFENDFDAEYEAVEETMHDVFPALLESGMTPADVLVWCCELKRPYGRYFTCYCVTAEPWKTPGPQYDKREVWLEVAERLTLQLDSLAPDYKDAGRYSIYSDFLPCIREAYRRAGCEESAIPVYERYVAKAECWHEAVDLASACGKADVAIELGRRGFREMPPDCYEAQYKLLGDVADAFAARGDFAHAAAILAELFLFWGGGCLKNRMVEAFHHVVDIAAKAGVDKEVRAALIYAHETGVNPIPLQYWKYEPPKQTCSWLPAPKRVVYRPPWTAPDPPPWPLPPSNEGIRLMESRWQESNFDCQSDREFLLQLALAEGDKDEIARQFCALPAFPLSIRFHPDPEVMKLIDLVRTEMLGFRPDIVEIIGNPQKHWKWGKGPI